MRHLVIGSTGYTGSWLVQLLVKKNIRPICFVRNLKKAETLFDEMLTNIDIIEKDLNNINKNDIFPGDIIYLTITSKCSNDFNIVSEYLSSFNHLLSNISECTIVFLSSQVVYGVPYQLEINESSPLDCLDYYSYEKIASEQLINLWAHRSIKNKYIIIRIPIIIGPWLKLITTNLEELQNSDYISYIMNKINNDYLIVNRSNLPLDYYIINLIDVRDLVEFMYYSLQYDNNNILNLSSGYMNLNTFYSFIYDLLKKEKKLVQINDNQEYFKNKKLLNADLSFFKNDLSKFRRIFPYFKFRHNIEDSIEEHIKFLIKLNKYSID